MDAFSTRTLVSLIERATTALERQAATLEEIRDLMQADPLRAIESMLQATKDDPAPPTVDDELAALERKRKEIRAAADDDETPLPADDWRMQ